MSDFATTERIRTVLDAIAIELASAMRKHPPMHTPHEAYAIILEELDEFWAQVKLRREHRSVQEMRTELQQVAAMAVRAIVDLELDRET